MSWMNLQTNPQNELLYVGFNQDYGCFACGTDTGFRIYNCDPFKETFQRDFNKGGIGFVEMLFRCNILALVGGGRNPRYPPNKVMIWDDHQNRCIGELSFRSEVKAVKLRRDRVVVVLEQKIYVYNFADLKLVDHIETSPNPKGLCALCPYSSNTVLVCPGLEKGHVRVELYDMKQTKIIAAHKTNLSCVALNFDGTRLATSSERGTLIRVFDTATGNPLQEVRRGADPAEIFSIAFNYNTSWMAVSSDKGTVHVFSVKDAQTDTPEDDDQVNGTMNLLPDISQDTGGALAATTNPSAATTSSTTASNGSSATSGANSAALAAATTTTTTVTATGGAASTASDDDKKAKSKHNPKSAFSFMKNLLPKYFSSEWSFAQFRVPEARTIVAFGAEKHSIIIVSADGTFYKALFDPEKGGEMVQEQYSEFIKTADAPE